MMNKTWKKALSAILTIAMVASSFSGFAVKAQAADPGKVEVTQNGNSVEIGNGYISREFSTADGKLSTVEITNKRTDDGNTVFTPAAGSEEFIIKTMAAAVPGISKEGWTAAADSWQGTDTDGDASKAIDGKTDTLWHSGYDNRAGAYKREMPMNFVINLGKATEFSTFAYTGRGNGNNGRINGYEIYLYNGDGATLGFDAAAWGSAVKSGNFQNNSDEQYVEFGEKVTATQIRIKLTSSYGEGAQANLFGSAAEFSLYETSPNAGGGVANAFAASALTVADTKVEATEATVNGVEKTGQKVTFEFAPFTYNGVEWNIKEVVVMYDGDSFMRKHLEISVPEGQEAAAGIEYIDLENMNIASAYLAEDAYWTIPEQANNPDMGNQKGDYLELGQPYYLAAMYWGCEFPQAETKIRDGNGFIRYHYGKTLAKDAHFEYNKNNTAGEMVTWDAVVGAARSTDYSVVQADFYEYIETIAVETNFRQQYNSWYDNMKNITKENLERSFFEIEKGFTQNGVNPLDSYVADDGWINYNSFWDFDPGKFPNELYDASLQAEQMGSRFGLWLGPRGGYGTEGTIASYIANNGLGSRNPNSGNDINISDARYLNKLRDDIFIGYQDKFNINYWKLDGMLLAPSTVPSEYYTTTNAFATISETYERWTDMYEDMRASRADGDLWINMTSYTNPSPWHVQWVNSVWMQNTGDTGYNNSFGNTDQEAMLTYRDNAYYNFLKEREWQLPNKYFYNHDPVYGMTANDAYNRPDIKYTTEELRDHLYMLGTRGTAFWEYYYSYSMFDEEKWDVNAEAAKWIEGNFDILQKAQMIGGKPANGDVYGFSCWNGSEGIVSLRNPKDVTQTYTLTFDRLIGVAEDTENVYGEVIIGDISYQNDDAISYGDTVEITLPAKEVLIVQYGAKDTTPAVIDSIHATAADTVEVEFNEAIRTPSIASFAVADNNVTEVSLKADRRTVVLTLENEMKNAAAVTVNVSGVKDTVGNETTATGANEFYKNGNVVTVENVSFDGSSTVIKDAAASIDGKEGFTIIGKFSTASENATILEQKDAYKVSIEDGCLVFELNNGLKVQSKYTEKTVNRSTKVVTSVEKGAIADGETHDFAAVKEINGMIKLYIDGKLVASAYDEAKVNPELAKGELVYGEGLAADVAYISVLDKAMAFDEVEDFESAPETEENLQITEGLSATTSGNVDESESDINNIFDGNPGTYWNSNSVDAVAAGNPNAVVDLGEVYKINQIDYTPRYHAASEYWACTGNIKKLVLEVSVDGETWTPVTAEGGLDISDKIVKTADPSFFPVSVTFDATEARYVRISATESFHWQYGQDGQPDNTNTSITIGDIAIFKAPEAKPVELPLETIVKTTTGNFEANGGAAEGPAGNATDNDTGTIWHTDWYPEDGNSYDDHWLQLELDGYYAVSGFKYLPRQSASSNGDITEYKILVSVDGENWEVADEGTFESGKAWKEITFEAKTAKYVRLQAVASLGDQPTKHFSAAAEVRVVGVETTYEEPEFVPADKSRLESLVNGATTDSEAYTEATWAVFAAALEAAREVLADEKATQEEVDAAYRELFNAALALEKKPEPTDKTALLAAIAAAEALNADDYTVDSWNEMQSMLTMAKVLAESEVSQFEVDYVAAALNEAITALVPAEKPVDPTPTPEVTPTPEPTPGLEVCEVFTDVNHDVWYEGYVQYVYDKGLMSGNDGLFKPTESVTRAQLVTTLYRLAGYPEVTDYSACDVFSDVKADKYYTDAICWAYNEGVTTGNPETGLFNTTGTLTRQQMAAFFFRFASFMGIETEERADISGMLNADKVSGYATEAVEWAVGSGLISGSLVGNDASGAEIRDLNPLGATTRAQLATILQRFCEGNNL